MTIASATLLVSSFQATAKNAYHAKLVTESLLLDIAKQDNKLIVVGERGHILISDDGENFNQVSVPTLATLTAVYTRGNQAWAVGHDAIILHSSDAGKSWQQQHFQPELQKPLMDVLFFDDKHGIAIGAYGSFYRTEDGGQNWLDELHIEFLHPDDQAYLNEIKEEDETFYLEELGAISPHLNRVSMDGERLLLAGEAGLLAFSDDLGRSWQQFEVDYAGSFFDIRKTLAGETLAAGLRGHLFRFDPASFSWSDIPSCSQASLNSIVSVNPLTTMIVGNNGNVLKLTSNVPFIEDSMVENISKNNDFCVADQQISLSQTDNSKAVVNAVVYEDKIIAVTAAGIQQLTLK